MKSPIIPITILIGGIIVAISVYTTTVKSIPYSHHNQSAVRPVNITDHIIGNPNAPVKIIEYSDLTCKYCKDFNSTMHYIMDTYASTGKVALVFREFPLIKVHKNAFEIAKSAECVAVTSGEDSFWKFINLIFTNQPVKLSELGKYAHQAGADPTKVATCMLSGKVNARITSDKSNALKIGATGAPYSVIMINGVQNSIIDGAHSYEYVKQQLDASLAIASSTAL